MVITLIILMQEIGICRSDCMFIKGKYIKCKSTGNLYLITGCSKSHVYFKGWGISGGIPKTSFSEDFETI